MIYQKLRRVSTHGEVDISLRYKFQEQFPEIKDVPTEEFHRRFEKLGVYFYTKKETPVKWWVRLTLPFVIIVWLLMFFGLPIHFMITGKWTYEGNGYIGNFIYNWFGMFNLGK